MVFAVCAGIVFANVFVATVLRGGAGVLVRIGWAVLIPVAAVAAVRAYRRGGRATRAMLALGIGAAAVVAGAGLTLPRIMKSGLTPWHVGGMAALAAGLVLLVLGAAIAIGGLRRWWKLAAIPVALLALYYVIAPLALALYVTHPPRPALDMWPATDRGFAIRDVLVPTADGVRLTGWYVPSSNGAAVVLLHGSGSTRSGVLDHLLALGEEGYGVLAIDARGHGDSGGTPMDWGWFGNLDISAAVDFLTRQPGVDPSRIGAVGLSMGGEEALTAAAADPRIRAVVSEGATMRAFSDWGSIPAPAVNRSLSAPFYWTQSAAADLMTSAAPPIALEAAMARIAPRPVLLIAADTPDERGFNRTYAAVSPASTELWTPNNTPHTGALAAHPGEWSRRVIGFLDRALRP
jgi:pimeloyl-ACP methyl ester carboxylesterase